MSSEDKNIEQMNDENIDESPTETENPIEVRSRLHFVMKLTIFINCDSIARFFIIFLAKSTRC